MTTISNINIVVQQGDTIKDAQNIKNQPLDPKEVTFAQQQEKEKELRETVHESESTEKIKPDEERTDKKKQNSGKEEKEGKKAEVKKDTEQESDPEAKGRLLDTIV
jgi:hypothetical protein